MLTVEEAFDITLIEEGQFLMGEDFITNTLGFTWDKIFTLFKKTIREYSRRRPIVETKVIRTTDPDGKILMPEGTLAVREIRYDILDEYPRYMYPGFGQPNYEFDQHTGVLRCFPPMSSMRVSYSREYTFSDSAPYIKKEYLADYEKVICLKLGVTPKKGTITVSRDGKSMKEVGIETVEVQIDGGVSVPVKMIKLAGDLGEAFFNPDLREIEIQLEEGANADIEISCKSKYPYCVELGTIDSLYLKLFKAHLLEAVASLRNQISQEDLHHIDFSNDDLYGRVRILKAEVNRNLRETIDFSAMAPI